VRQLARFAASQKIGYTLLSDAGAKIISAFGLINEEFAPGSAWYGIAHPLTMVVDRQGVIRHRFSEKNYSSRPDVDVVLDVLRKEAGQ
jgi:peroxiredoxin